MKEIGNNTLLRKFVFPCRYRPDALPVYPTCGHNSSSFSCMNLTMKQILDFHTLFYSNKTKNAQDNFILKYCSAIPVNRHRPTKSVRVPKDFQSKFTIRVGGTTTPVCKKTFLQVLQITRARVEFVLKTHAKTGNVPCEKRGGDHTSSKYDDKRQSVIKFISNLKCSEVHYCRSVNGRRYLSSDLNVVKLWTIYNNQSEDCVKVKKSYFRYVFNRKFNLGFGSPRVDVCSTCIEFQERLKVERDPNKKLEIQAMKQIHKKRAKAFYALLQEDEPGCIIISFDCQKNLPLPKIPDQETYYRRQLYLYNFTVVVGNSKSKLTPDNCFSYVWTEDTNKKGSNEVASCVFHRLQNLDLTNINKIKLFADACGGQNKNKTMLAMCCRWLLSTPDHVKEMELVFPVRGHSFIPPDRVFALSEKEVRKIEVIDNPEIYVDIIKKHSTVVNLGLNCDVANWKTESEKVFKNVGAWHLKFAQCKRYQLKKAKSTPTNVLVKGEAFYMHEVGSYRFITKQGKCVSDINPDIIENNITHLNVKKLKDVQRLLHIHYGENWRANDNLSYYKNILDRNTIPPQENIQEEDDDECELMDEAPELAD